MIGLKESLIKEIKREEIENNKFILHFQIQEENEANEMPDPIEIEIIHVENIDSTMPASIIQIKEINYLLYIILLFKIKVKEKEIENGQG